MVFPHLSAQYERNSHRRARRNFLFILVRGRLLRGVVERAERILDTFLVLFIIKLWGEMPKI